LKEPLGTLIRGSPNQTMHRLGRMIEEERPPKVIAVGDVVSRSMVEHGLQPDIIVVDHRVMRSPSTPFEAGVDRTVRVRNPAGTITEEAWLVLRDVMRQEGRTRVLVDGEEDLLTLVVGLHAPDGSFVVYGQPHEGIVVVRVTESKRRMFRQIVNLMEVRSKS